MDDRPPGPRAANYFPDIMHGDCTITNCRLSSSDSDRFSLHVTNGRIALIEPSISAPVSGPVLDAGGRLVSAGLIDVHIQGAGGADILDGTEEALRTIAKTCARFGVTSILATTVYRPAGDNRHLENAARFIGRDLGGARIAGIHLEGPFIAMEKRGMIQRDGIGGVSRSLLDDLWTITGNGLKMMTIAPELPGNLDIIRELRRRGVVYALAHSMATYEQAQAGIDAGITHATHLFNAMQPIHHRAPGPVPAVFENADVSAQVICDGVHLHPSIIRMIWSILGPDRFVSITDGIQALGLSNGRYTYNGIEYEARDGTARYHDGTLIGTCLGLNQLIRRLATFTGCSVEDALQTATLTPARVLGIDGRTGSIDVGRDADLAVFNDDLSVWATIVGGEIVFKAG